MCEGRRLKKRKTSTKRNTLNPIYNEAIVFDVPPENINQISLLIAVMDYDRFVTDDACFAAQLWGWTLCSCAMCRVGHNEIIGVCRVGNEADTLGRDHWSEMLTYPRKPVAHWHPLIEVLLFVYGILYIIRLKLYIRVKVDSLRNRPTQCHILDSASVFLLLFVWGMRFLEGTISELRW